MPLIRAAESIVVMKEEEEVLTLCGLKRCDEMIY